MKTQNEKEVMKNDNMQKEDRLRFAEKYRIELIDSIRRENPKTLAWHPDYVCHVENEYLDKIRKKRKLSSEESNEVVIKKLTSREYAEYKRHMRTAVDLVKENRK